MQRSSSRFLFGRNGQNRYLPFRWLVVCLLAFGLGCGDTEPEPTIPPGSDILLVTVDTLRADHLSSYGYPRQTSPFIDSLAADGVRFDQAIVQWPKTGPSFASMLTSTYPKDNGIVRQIGIPVPDEMDLLAEKLSAAGYSTHAVVANGALSREFGFHQGFDDYVETWQTEAPEGVERDGARHVTNLALGLADQIAARRAEPSAAERQPYFLWVHYLDPHFPYTPPEPFTDRFQGDEHWDADPLVDIDRSKHRRQMTGIGRSQVLDERDELAFYVARYDAEIAWTDSQVERLFQGLAERDLRDRRLTVFSSDHGESLGEHAFYFDHGRFGFQTCLRVPLILHYPGVLEPREDREPVALIDLSPTLLEVAGVELEEGGTWRSGSSLAPRLSGGASKAGQSEGQVVFSEAGNATDGNWQRIAQNRRYKLIYARVLGEQRWIGGENVEWVLYDLQEDPGETRDVLAEHPEQQTLLLSQLRRWLHDKADAAVRQAFDANEMDEETREQLRSLGYID